MTTLSSEVITNVLGHCKECWNYDYPTGKTLENAFYEGVKPFHADSKKLGSSFTIVDVAQGTNAFELKGSKALGFLKRVTGAANHGKNKFISVSIPNVGNLLVRVPYSIMTQIRRPVVDLHNYKGNPKEIILEQIEDYVNFAKKSCEKGGFDTLYSGTLLYGTDEKKGVRGIVYTQSKFSIPTITDYTIGYKEDGKTPCSYQAIGEDGLVVFQLSSFNKGSSNFYKRYYVDVDSLNVLVWAIKEQHAKIFTKEELSKDSVITLE